MKLPNITYSLLSKCTNYLLKPLTHNLRFFISMYLLGAICILTTGERSYFPYFAKLFAELFLDLYLLCCILTLMPTKIKYFCRTSIYIVLYLIAIIDIFCYVRLGSTFTPQIMRLISETNITEAEGFFQSYISFDTFLSPIGVIFLLLICHIFISFINIPQFNIRLPLWITLTTVISLLIVGIQSSLKNKYYMYGIFRANSISTLEYYLGKEFYISRSPYIPIYRFMFALHSNNLRKQQETRIIRTLKNSTVDSCTFTSPNIVLIIGESYNKHHSQLYGYSLPTTPYQSKRASEGNLFVFSDAVTPFNLTNDVLENAFSTNDLSQHEEWCDKPLFTTLFKKAGYQVTFISNEFIENNKSKEFYDFAGNMFLNGKEISKLQFDKRNKSLHQYDEGIVLDYKKLKTFKNPHNLIIFSLFGQHIAYRERFPDNFNKFSPTDYNRKDLTYQDLEVLASYDNATLYNDYVLETIIRLFENKEVIIIYMPDHGEECFDNSKNFGRSHKETITKNIAKYQFEIPFWIWCSELYHSNHPDIIRLIAQATNRPFFSDDLSQLLLYLGGISHADYKPELNILSPKYYSHRKRLLRGKIDYDELLSKNHKCSF